MQKKLLELLDDEEQKQRLSIVKSLVQQERSSGRESIATVSFFFVEDENGNIIEDRRLSQFAQTNNMSPPEEAKETIRKIILDILGIIVDTVKNSTRTLLGGRSSAQECAH
ncbi:hypothetical protein [Thermococcus sp. JCM 11816]|uniref:hypothetical protein n=1 Tax=Thermococcus sp. (strain JCM 11816 / KS-1) TaxID=1295125 RepID=UPI0006D193CC